MRPSRPRMTIQAKVRTTTLVSRGSTMMKSRMGCRRRGASMNRSPSGTPMHAVRATVFTPRSRVWPSTLQLKESPANLAYWTRPQPSNCGVTRRLMPASSASGAKKKNRKKHARGRASHPSRARGAAARGSAIAGSPC